LQAVGAVLLVGANLPHSFRLDQTVGAVLQLAPWSGPGKSVQFPAMKDQKKTKAQLIQELVAERQKTAATDVSAVERLLAVERVRAQAVDMRGTHDLRQVVAVVFKEMRRLEIDTPAASIIFLDEEAETGTHYGACVDPKTLGFARDDDPAEDRFVVLDDILADGGQPRPLQEEQRERLVGSWRSGEIGTSSATTDIGVFVDHYSSLLDMTAEAVREWLTDMHGDWAITNVPFRFGLIGYREREHHAEHDEIVADLAGGLELGYRRFLDFQKVESQNRALVVEQALERVRTQVGGDAADQRQSVRSRHLCSSIW
jgi:hypothetical protein